MKSNGKLLLHLPLTKYSPRRFIVPVYSSNRLLRPSPSSDFLPSLPIHVNDGTVTSLNPSIASTLTTPAKSKVKIKSSKWTNSELLWNEVEVLSQIPSHPLLIELHGIASSRISSQSNKDEEGDDVFHSINGPYSSVNLRDILINKAKKRIEWLTMISLVMCHLHSDDIVLCDLRPSRFHLDLSKTEDEQNTLILTRLERARWCTSHQSLSTNDFGFVNGIGKEQDPFTGEDIVDSNTVHEDDVIEMSTYVAPEVMMNWKGVNRKIDIYSFGKLIHQFFHFDSKMELSGRGLPIEDQQKKELYWTHPECTPTLRRLAERCLSLDPDTRPDFDEIVQSLERDYATKKWTSITSVDGMDKPVNDKNSLIEQEKGFLKNIGTCASIGHVRRSMEDSLSVLEFSVNDGDKYVFASVFDGLRNSRSAEFAARFFALSTFDGLMSASAGLPTVTSSTVALSKEVLAHYLRKTDQVLAQVLPSINCGSTATVSLITPTHLAIAWLGDSSGYLFRQVKEDLHSRSSPHQQQQPHYQAISLINKHSPNRADESKRIVANDGMVVREMSKDANGQAVQSGPWRAMAKMKPDDSPTKPRLGLAVSRALGLFELRPILSGEPEFVDVERSPDKDLFMVIASDGLYVP